MFARSSPSRYLRLPGRTPAGPRVGEIIRLIGYTAGGLPASRILQRLALSVSDDTVIRAVKCCDKALADTRIRSLGVDDWAWRKGQSYGTILVDLEKHRVVDLLPDRSTESVKAWLEKHSGIEIISRDRCGIYAEAAQQGAADALQVADRFHLLMNLSAAIERALEERSSELCLAAEVQQQVCVRMSARSREENNAGRTTKATATRSPPPALRARH